MEDNNNQTSLARLQTSLQTEYSAAIQKYGKEYSDFLRQYPTLGRRSEFYQSIYAAVKEEGMSLVQIDNRFSKGASEWWLKVMLIEMFSFLGAMESVTAFQIKGIAARIRKEYYFLTPSELSYFFYSFSMGDYGKLYVGRTINPQDVLSGIRDFASELIEQRRIFYERKNIEKLTDEKKEGISYDQWKKEKGLPQDYDIFKKLSDKMNVSSETKEENNNKQ